MKKFSVTEESFYVLSGIYTYWYLSRMLTLPSYKKLPITRAVNGING